MKLLENLKLKLRANKYRTKDDIGGIAYILKNIKSGQTVLDIGAHKAGYLYFLIKKVGENGKIFAFEPQSKLYNYILGLKKTFNWHNVTIEHLALSDSAGTVTLYIPTNKVSKASSPGATILDNRSMSSISATETVKTETLDSYCNRLDIKPDFLKIDVEGNELKIFQGGVDTIKNYKPKILVEIEARHIGQLKVLETFKFMEAMGYNGYIIDGLSYIPISEFNFEKHQDINNMKNYRNNFIFE